MESKYMEIKFKETWFRIAGMAQRIKNLEPPPHWRFEVAENSKQYPLHDFHITGQATSENNRPGVNQQAEGEELLAWIAGYGNVTVNESGLANFELHDPPTPCPWD